MFDNVRDYFPALARQHNGRPVAYFDGPGGTQIAQASLDGMNGYLMRHNANTHWAYPSSEETDAVILGARHAVAQLLNAASDDEIVFGANMTTLNFHLSRALARRCSSGDEIVVTELDHHANVDPWREAARDFDLNVKTVRMSDRCELDYDDLAAKISSRTRIVAVGAASNAFGTINDVAGAVALAKRAGALCVVDAVHYAAHEPIDVRAWDCDFLLCSSYKFYGPHLGILYGKLAELADADVPRLAPAAALPPESWETGTLNHEGIAGLTPLLNFMAGLSQASTYRERLIATFAAFSAGSQAQYARLCAAIGDLPNARLFGLAPHGRRTPTLSFEFEGIPSERVARELADDAIFASHGDFYAQSAVRRVSTAGSVVRLGCAWYTSDDDVERALASLRRIAAIR